MTIFPVRNKFIMKRMLYILMFGNLLFALCEEFFPQMKKALHLSAGLSNSVGQCS